MKLFKLLTFLLFPLFSFSQAGEWDEETTYVPPIEPKHTINFDVRIPLIMSNPAYKLLMREIIDLNLAYNYHFPFHLVVGAGVRFMYNQLNVTKVEPGLSGAIGSIGPFINVGYERFLTERFGLGFSTKFGGTFNSFNTSKNRINLGQSYRNDAAYIEPNISLILTASAATSFRLNIGYTIQGYKFHPYDLGSVSKGNWTPEELNKVTQILTIGFGFTYYIGQN